VTTEAPQAPIANVGEAEQAIANLNAITDQLTEAIEQETEHVRAGRLRNAAEVGQTKAELARQYAAESARIVAIREFIASSLPGALPALRERHTAFQTLLHSNMTVLATAQAVSESIIRGVSSELARKRSPSTYGASGRANVLGAKASQPIAVCRTL
jgi:hypothetical protein